MLWRKTFSKQFKRCLIILMNNLKVKQMFWETLFYFCIGLPAMKAV